MAVTMSITYSIRPDLINRKDYLLQNFKAETISSLYPDTIKTQADVDAIVNTFPNDCDPAYQVATNPGCISFDATNYEDANGRHTQCVWVFEDMATLTMMMDKHPIVLDWRPYEIVGTNLVNKSDGTIVTALDAENYIRWWWNIFAQVVSVRSEPVQI